MTNDKKRTGSERTGLETLLSKMKAVTESRTWNQNHGDDYVAGFDEAVSIVEAFAKSEKRKGNRAGNSAT